jgi:hypothetical protein
MIFSATNDLPEAAPPKTNVNEGNTF